VLELSQGLGTVIHDFFIQRPQGHPLERHLGTACSRFCHKGEYIFTQVDRPDYVYYLKSGLVRLSVLRENGDEKTFFLISHNSTFGEAAVFDANPYVATATALRNSLIYAFHRDELLRLMKLDPQLIRALLASLACKVGRLASQVEGLTFLGVKERVCAALGMLLDRPGYESHSIEVPLTHQELADMIGASRVAVSRALGELEREGIVTLRNRLIIVHPRTRRSPSSLG